MISKIQIVVISLTFLIILNMVTGFVLSSPPATTKTFTTPSINASSNTASNTTISITKTSNSSTISTYYSNIQGKNYGIFGLNLNWLVYPFLAFADGFIFAFSNIATPNISVSIIADIMAFIDTLLISIFVIAIVPFLAS